MIPTGLLKPVRAPVILDAYHEQMRVLVVDHLRDRSDPDATAKIAAMLNGEHDPEYCEQCGYIFCPFNEQLHFHHDGCPCCDMVPDELWDQGKADAARLARLTV